MKRLYIAIAFLIISISLCVFEQLTIESTYKSSEKYIAEAIEYTQKDDYKNALKTCKSFEKYWNKKYAVLSPMVEHSQLDEFGITVNSLEELADTKSDDLEQQLIEAKGQIKNIRDNQKINFGNIF